VIAPKIICFANAKGGVGKTKTAVALSDCLIGHHGQRTLVIDTDQQASASLFMLECDLVAYRRITEQRKTIESYFESILGNSNEHSLASCVVPKCRVFRNFNSPNAYGSLIGSSERVDFVEDRILTAATSSNEATSPTAAWLTKYDSLFKLICPKFKRDIIDVCNRVPHEYVVIDTAAGFHLFALICLMIADIIIVPTVPDIASLSATTRFIAQIHKYETSHTQKVPGMHLLYTKVQPGYQSHIENIERLAATASIRQKEILSTPFLQRDVIAQIDNAGGPAQTFDEKYGVSAANVKLFTSEILRLL
jgi:cellulose biosynthesis protein BcsQ